MVRVVETRGNRAHIDFPVEGWCSIMAKDGRHILQILEVNRSLFFCGVGFHVSPTVPKESAKWSPRCNFLEKFAS